MSSLSTTTSMIQSVFLIFSKSSSKFPTVILSANFGVYKRAGLAFFSFAKFSVAILFLTILSSLDNPFFCSASVNSKGTISSKSTSTPILAKCAAIPEPIIPEPRTVTCLILRFIFFIFYYLIRWRFSKCLS